MLTPRQSALIAEIVDKYISSAKPISSKYIEKSGFFNLKSATIRSEMNELEALGYLAQLHTSGGRVPTDRAYRYYVDNFVEPEKSAPSPSEKRLISNVLSAHGGDPHRLNKKVAEAISGICGNLVIAGIEEDEDFFKVGLSSLFGLPDFQEFERAARLTNFFDAFEDIFNQLSHELFEDFPYSNQNLKVFIGRENPIADIRDETVVLARYRLPGNYTGSLTLVGPTRMDYGKNIGLVKYTTEELNKLAKQG